MGVESLTVTNDVVDSAAAQMPDESASSQQPEITPSSPEFDQVLLTRVGLRIPAELSFEDWERAGHRLSGIVDSSSWCLGDWLAYGKQKYADRYKKAINSAGLQYQTLRNYAWVSRQFELARRRPRLTFQHHAEVASLPHSDQDHFLDMAEREMWTTKQLRTHIRDGRNDDPDETGQHVVIPRIEVPDDRLEWWRRAADQSGMDFETWVRATLDGAAVQALGDEAAAEVDIPAMPATPALLRQLP